MCLRALALPLISSREGIYSVYIYIYIYGKKGKGKSAKVGNKRLLLLQVAKAKGGPGACGKRTLGCWKMAGLEREGEGKDLEVEVGVEVEV